MKDIAKIAAILAVIVMTVCSITVLDSADAADESESVELTPVDLNQAYLDSIGASVGRYDLNGNNAYTLKENLNLGSYYLYVKGTCSLDLNGYSITSSAENTINVRNTMTIIDSSGGNGAVISTYSGTSSYTGAVTNFGTLTIEGGSFEGITAIKMNQASNGTLNINGGTFEGNECIVINSGNATLTNGTFTGGDVAVLCRNNSNYSLDVYIEGGTYTADTGVVIMGKSSQTTSLTVSGGDITGTNYGISGNGSYDNTSITVEGGKISATNVAGIYHPQVGDLKVTNGTITGSTGIQFCGAGSINISGGTITGNGNFTGPTKDDTSDASGFIYDGYALSIVTREGYHDADDTIEVSISGGNFISKHGSAISTYRFQITGDQVKINEDSSLESIVKAVEISDGDFNSAAEYAIVADPADVQADRYDVTGGKFTGGSVQDDLLGDGYGMVDGEVVVTEAVAHIGETSYATIQDAIDAVQDGETITLVESDESLVISSNINPKTNIGFTIDLNGRTLDFGDTYRIVGSSGNGKLTISNGTLDFGHPSPIQVMGYTLELVNCKVIGTGYTTANDGSTSGTTFIWMFGSADSSAEEYSNLIVDSDTEFVFDNNSVDLGAYIVNVNFLNYGSGDPNNVYAAYGVTVDFAGKMTGNIGCAFYVNGNVKPTDGNVPKIHIDMSDEIKTGGGIYAAGYAEWDIDGCNFEAYSAISIKSGIFDISGGVFHATGEFKDPADANGNGSEDTGAAISITSNSGYPQKTVVNISGGKFTSDNGYAVYEGIAKKADGTDADDASYATISISGGDFKGNSEKGDVKIDRAEDKKVITGGEFSGIVDEEYIAFGFELTEKADGGYSVEDAGIVPTLAVSDSSPQQGDTVTATVTVPGLGDQDVSYAWTFNGTAITGSKTCIFAPDRSGTLSVAVTVITGGTEKTFTASTEITVTLPSPPTDPEDGETTVVIDENGDTVTTTTRPDGSKTETTESTIGDDIKTETVVETPAGSSDPQTITTVVTVPEGETVSDAVVNEAIGKIENSSSGDADKTLAFVSETSESVDIPTSSLSDISNAGVSLSLTSSDVTVTFSPSTLESISQMAEETVGATSIKTTAENASGNLNQSQSATVGDATVYDVSAFLVDENNEVLTQVSRLGDMTPVTIPYELPTGISPEDVVVYFMDDYGNLTSRTTVYEDGMVTFWTEHFSYYVIGDRNMIADEPDTPDYPPFIPGDDDDVYIPPTVVVDQGQSDDDETVKIAACAAAAVAAAILAVLAIALYRKD